MDIWHNFSFYRELALVQYCNLIKNLLHMGMLQVYFYANMSYYIVSILS